MKYVLVVAFVIGVVFFTILGSLDVSNTVETKVIKEHFVNGVYVLELNGCHLEIYGRGTTAMSVAIVEGTTIVVPAEYLNRRVNAMGVHYIIIKE